MIWNEYDTVVQQLDKEHLDNLSDKAIMEIITFFKKSVNPLDYLDEEVDSSFHKVLNVKPGHGKTTALMLFLAKILEDDHKKKSYKDFGCLIVIREVSQMREIQNFLQKFSTDKNSIRYIDAKNFTELKGKISDTRFLIITHERLKREALNKAEGIEVFNPLFNWQDKKRFVFIDEQPPFANSADFTLENNSQWAQELITRLRHNGDKISREEEVIIRSMISIVVAKELMNGTNKADENIGLLKTGPLKQHVSVNHQPIVLDNFFQTIEDNLRLFRSLKEFYQYRLFRKIYEGEAHGYIDLGSLRNSNNHSNMIICSEKINYQVFKRPILILDASAHIASYAYNDYELEELNSYTNYKKVKISQRVINTSASRRKDPDKSVQKIIKRDFEKIKNDWGIKLLLLFSKGEEVEYLTDEEFYARKAHENSHGYRSMHLMNTLGKNEIESEYSIYITNLPIRVPDHYIKLTIAAYTGDTDEELTKQADTETSQGWFINSSIEKTYQQELFAELYQIIHRTMLRNIKRDPEIPVNIFIATDVKFLIEKFNEKYLGVNFDSVEIDKKEYLKEKLDEIGPEFIALLNTHRDEIGNFPTQIGRIAGPPKIIEPFKQFVNNHWYKDYGEELIREYFHRSKYTFYTAENGWKYIKLFDNES